MMHDPRFGNVGLDANVLDYDGVHDALIERLLDLSDANEINLVIPGSVQREIGHGNTPARVKALMAAQISSQHVNRTPGELNLLRRIRDILAGNAKPGKHDADGEHLFEAQKYCSYFVTHDGRILSKRKELAELLGGGLAIAALKEILAAYDATK
jgi:hypothetical protein